MCEELSFTTVNSFPRTLSERYKDRKKNRARKLKDINKTSPSIKRLKINSLIFGASYRAVFAAFLQTFYLFFTKLSHTFIPTNNHKTFEI